MEWQFAAVTLETLLLALGLLIVLVIIVWQGLLLKRTRIAMDMLKEDMSVHTANVDAQVKQVTHQQNEAQARSLVVAKHVHALQTKQDDFDNQLREQKLQDPSLRLYQRAADLVKQGATIEEIMDACDIPRAEAEMLIMVHKTQS
ncbi:DUF2802 domain-containing protein [Alteromonas sp. A079]|uniref:DUF2802 domain-containing protein n=1 Tax=Alteromonas sp. A079 TaxID=3410268 RepID=UPI003BA13B32